MKKVIFTASLLLSVYLLAAPASAQVADTKALTLEGAKNIAVAAEAEARRNNWNVVIAIVDAGGHMVFLQRMDETQAGSIDIAIKKAQTSALFKRPTKAFEDGVAGGRNALLSLDILPLEGGLPIVVDGRYIGGIGVSGVTSEQDGVIAQAGLNALRH